ncbi:Cell wall-associated hydrolase, NlpC family [Abditibacterium utsteinense]|uniref:Cell wall-associated hydrolase, NlpC family n=1 Tax=Abditibacterium utsteinense TaxID=1960156 RepID=A0A2S8SWF2_9BACT|nr:SH3 domain-containing C40 family peptidase [Abditibacterium utsteinense]PQV65104.1 Cell wall-associated hydrolase, NlpC family [Abditibacterium utsteinense]
MPFLRPGHDGTFASPIAPSAPKSRRVSQYLTLFSLSAASLASSASAKPFKAVGVKAWTSGSQTFIRARPSAEVPPVAKVGRHTPLYVWGKYNGWYRVETHDHIFGWVFNQYIETPKADKVRAMPQSKARLASNRTAGQKLYGSPQLLQKYFAAYGAPGASKSESKPRVRLATNLKVASLKSTKNPQRTTTKSKFLLTKTASPMVAAHEAQAKTTKQETTKPRLATQSATPRLVAVPRLQKRLASRSVTSIGAPRVISPVPRLEKAARVTPVIRPVAKTVIRPVVKPVVRIVSAKNVDSASFVANRSIAPALSGKMSGYAAPQVETFEQPRGVVGAAAQEKNSPAREVQSEKIAGSSRALTPSAKFFARAANEAASRRETPAAAENDGPPTDSNFQPIPVAPPVASITPSAPRPKVRAARVRRSAKASTKKSTKKSVARASSKKRFASRKERQREQLRARMGMVPTAPHSVIAPVSPAELMKARQEYLNSRRARLGLPATPVPNAPGTPVGGVSPLPAPDGPLGGPSATDLAPMAPAQFAPMSFEPSHPLAPLLGDPYVLALAQLKPSAATTASATTASTAAVVRGGSPRDRALTRGGSPRDRFGAGMASQALSYRGMRYIRGAASPKRGFDCSGLVYFLLRQRGYNPPRTAAGYRNWGASVPKNQLKSGDLLLFANTYKRGISHIGVYMGDGKFVHAATSSTGVRVSSLRESYYAGKYFGARRAK